MTEQRFVEVVHAGAAIRRLALLLPRQRLDKDLLHRPAVTLSALARLPVVTRPPAP